MNAIGNVGELASPYFLIEVWARRDEINIDPETFATLKRQARGLVRDARAAQSRGEEPEEDWRARRRHLLGLDELIGQSVTLEDGTDYCLDSWRDGEGRDALLVTDLESCADPDHRDPGEVDPPSTRFELALGAYRGRADWGLLLAGLDARLYRRSSGISQQYLALSLDA
ncbi:MAG: hypothetical protein ACRD0J_00410, partial [Acidimicrobiales bacterium]